MLRRRAVSPAITVLVLVMVAIAVGIVVGMHLLNLSHEMSSRGASVMVTAQAVPAGGGYYVITVRVRNAGPEGVMINEISIVAGNTTVCFDNPYQDMAPGAEASFTLVCRLPLEEGSVIVYGTTDTTYQLVSVGARIEFP